MQEVDGLRDLIVKGRLACALFFQAEDGIRDLIVTGVQTCALPISRLNSSHDQISYAVFCLRSEEHTSELQSRSDLVCRLLLDRKTDTRPTAITNAQYTTSSDLTT